MSKYMWHIYGNLYDSYIWLPYMPIYEKAIHFLVYEMIYVVHICPSPICCHIFLTNMLSYISKCISAYILKYYKIGRFKYVKIYVAHIWQLIWPIYLTTIYARIWDSNNWNWNYMVEVVEKQFITRRRVVWPHLQQLQGFLAQG